MRGAYANPSRSFTNVCTDAGLVVRLGTKSFAIGAVAVHVCELLLSDDVSVRG